jgi:high-affinity nickel-transport protein
MNVLHRPWKLYPLGVLFGLGFDTSSEIALLGISSIQAVQGTSIWLIMIFPILFTAGMCLIDTTDGGLMLTLYTWHDDDDVDVKGSENSQARLTADLPADALPGDQGDLESGAAVDTARDDIKISKNDDLADELPALEMDDSTSVTETPALQPRKRQQDPLIFLYYSTILTGVTVIVALVIGTIQLLSLILNVAEPTGKFWDGVTVASDHYEVIGGAICGLFLIVGVGAIVFYGRFKRWAYATRERNLVLRNGRQRVGREQDIVEEVAVELAV